jgi:hypothetical protein
VAVLAALLFVLAGCGDDDPPEETLAGLGSRVGDAKMDDLDFATLVTDFTVPEFADTTQPDLANYQLYLAAKAADLALNQAEPPDLVETEKRDRGDAQEVSFNFSRKEGLFAVADISRVAVELVETDNATNPWRIRRITLSR